MYVSSKIMCLDLKDEGSTTNSVRAGEKDFILVIFVLEFHYAASFSCLYLKKDYPFDPLYLEVECF